MATVNACNARFESRRGHRLRSVVTDTCGEDCSQTLVSFMSQTRTNFDDRAFGAETLELSVDAPQTSDFVTRFVRQLLKSLLSDTTHTVLTYLLDCLLNFR